MNIIDYYIDNNKPIKLNIGCRNKPLPTYINIDIDKNNPYADMIDNGFKLKKIIDESCDLIEAIHMFEHLSYNESLQALNTWYDKLKPGGILRLSVPDAEKCAALLLLTRDKNIVKTMFCGSQNDEFDFHKNIHTKSSLKSELQEVGFSNICEWDWRTTFPHSYVDSYCSSYWPHMRKNFIMDNGRGVDLGGINLSLNLEGVK